MRLPGGLVRAEMEDYLRFVQGWIGHSNIQDRGRTLALTPGSSAARYSVGSR
jgi:hypothetical protein